MSEELDKIKQEVEQRLLDAQQNKEFKDIGRVAQTRKERSAYKLISGTMLRDLELDQVMAYNMVTKENVWQPIDVQAEKERGASSGATFIKVKIREAVPKRPKDDKNKRAGYVLFLELLQKDFSICMNVSEIEELIKSYNEMQLDQLIGYFVDADYLTADEETRARIKAKIDSSPLAKSRLTSYGAIKKLVNEVFGAEFENILFQKSDAAYSKWIEARQKDSINEEQSKLMIEVLTEKKNKSVQRNLDSIEKYKRFSNQELIESMRKEWQGSTIYNMYKNNVPGYLEWLGNRYQRMIKTLLDEFDKNVAKVSPRPEDWSWFDDPKVKKEVKTKEKSINTKTALTYIKRTGGYKITSVTPKEIVDKFGFSAVNYGNALDDVWSKEHTKHFLGAISDLGEMMNLDIKQMNDLGKLGIAFAAKGRKGHSATYFPQTKDINLTKSNGDGSVAHEWGHYFDNVICDLEKRVSTASFASEGLSPDYEIKLLFKEFMTFVIKGDPLYTPKVPMKFYAKKATEIPTYSKKEGWSYVKKTVEIKPTIEETIADVQDLAVVGRDFYNLQLRVFGYIIDAFGLESYEVPMTLKTSYFYHKSAYNYFVYSATNELGRPDIVVSQRTKYWTSDVELWARAWETIVLKKLMDKNRESNYLVDDIDMTDVIAETWFAPYPQGKELEHLESIVDRIIIAVKNRFNIGTFKAPSDIREDIYLDFEKTNDTGTTDSGMTVEKEETESKVTFVEQDTVVKVVEDAEAQKDMQDAIDVVESAIEPIVDPEKEMPFDEENIQEVIDGLEILLESASGSEKQELSDVIEGLKLLL